MITSPGLINVDFADVRTVMSVQGQAMIGFGSAVENPVQVEQKRQLVLQYAMIF